MKVKLHIIKLILLSLLVSACVNTNKRDLSELPAPELLINAKQDIADSSYDNALESLREIEARFPYSVHAQQAILETAYLYHKKNDAELAIASADRFIHTYPTHKNVDYAYYIKGLANYTQHRSFIGKLSGSKDFSDRDPQSARASFDAFSDLTTRFPNSMYVPDSIEKMSVLLNTIAKHDTNIAKFYLDRSAYVAVVNRCKYVIEHYQGTPAVEDALGMMIISYREMGLNDLANDSWRVLKENFPYSRYLQETNS